MFHQSGRAGEGRDKGSAHRLRRRGSDYRPERCIVFLVVARPRICLIQKTTRSMYRLSPRQMMASNLLPEVVVIVCLSSIIMLWQNGILLDQSLPPMLPRSLISNSVRILRPGFSYNSSSPYINWNGLERAHSNEMNANNDFLTQKFNNETNLIRPILAICTATRSLPSWKNIEETELNSLLLPSVIKTTDAAASQFDLRVYLAIDDDDTFWQNHVRVLTQKFSPLLKLYPCFFRKLKKNRIPFNELMRRAYDDGAQYMVRVNDDTEFTSPGWIELGVKALAAFKPKNVGVVGPTCRQGNTKIMTHDMVHRTHLHIFPTYYPPIFSAWWIDDWITEVYKPGRSVKIAQWIVQHHTRRHGTRYDVQHHEGSQLGREVEKGRETLREWIRSHDG